MTKTSTVQFTINDLASKSEKELIDIDSLFNLHGEFEDVFELLNQLNLDVRQELVENILNLASELDRK